MSVVSLLSRLNIPLPDEFDIGKMERVFLRLIERHENLYTSFLMINEEPLQRANASGFTFGYGQGYSHKR